MVNNLANMEDFNTNKIRLQSPVILQNKVQRPIFASHDSIGFNRSQSFQAFQSQNPTEGIINIRNVQENYRRKNTQPDRPNIVDQKHRETSSMFSFNWTSSKDNKKPGLNIKFYNDFKLVFHEIQLDLISRVEELREIQNLC